MSVFEDFLNARQALRALNTMASELSDSRGRVPGKEFVAALTSHLRIVETFLVTMGPLGDASAKKRTRRSLRRLKSATAPQARETSGPPREHAPPERTTRVGADEERILACVRKSSDPMSVSALSEETQIEATILRHILVRLAAKRRITMQVTDAGVRVRERAHTP